MKPRSLSFNLLLAASLMLASFFALVAVIIEQGFRASAEQGLKEKLQIQVYALLSVAELVPEGNLIMHSNLHEIRFAKPGSGLYAFIHNQQRMLIWRTNSAVGLDFDLPTIIKPGKAVFTINKAGQFVLNYAVIWETEAGEERQFIFSVAEDGQFVVNQVQSFRRFLWIWLAVIGFLLVIIQFFVLRWSLRPLRIIATDLAQIESGSKSYLKGLYPLELQGLADNLNALIGSERAHLERYRNTLADLSHSLKTPLTILRGLDVAPGIAIETRTMLQVQVARMDDIVEYQLKRAAAKGQKKLAGSVDVRLVLEKIVGSTAKVYINKNIKFEVICPEHTRIYCEEGDLYEIAGNLIDNAAKWCQNQIKITLVSSQQQAIRLLVEDDGPGIPEHQVKVILKRGIRADENVKGHGIGMAIVNELVVLLGGELKGEPSELLGGMKWIVDLQ